MINIVFLYCFFFLMNHYAVLSQDTSDCGILSGCFRKPENCISQSCIYLVKWQADSFNINIQLYGNILQSGSDRYLAIGFSNDTRMGDDDVVLCESSGSRVLHYFNNGKTPAIQSTNPYQNKNVAKNGSWLLCSLTRPLKNASVTNFYDLTNSYYLLLATGTCNFVSYLLPYLYTTYHY